MEELIEIDKKNKQHKLFLSDDLDKISFKEIQPNILRITLNETRPLFRKATLEITREQFEDLYGRFKKQKNRFLQRKKRLPPS